MLYLQKKGMNRDSKDIVLSVGGKFVSFAIDLEHTTIQALRDSYNMYEGEGASYYLLQESYRVHTKAMDWRLLQDFGYPTNKNDALSWHNDCLKPIYKNTMSLIYNTNPKQADMLVKCGIDVDSVLQAASRCFGIDIKFLNDKSIPNQLILPCSHIRMSHGQAIQEFENFPTSTRKAGHSIKQSGQILENGIQNVLSTFKHYDGISPLLSKEAAAEHEELHQRLEDAIARAIKYVEVQGGRVNTQFSKKCVNRVPDKNISLEEAEAIARNALSLTDVKDGVTRIWSSHTFKKVK